MRIDFALMNVDNDRTVLDVTLADSISAGFQSIALADHYVSLVSGVNYRWYVLLVPNPSKRAEDVISTAGLRRTDKVDSGQEWQALARRSIWYDAFSLVSSRTVTDETYADAQRQLLVAIGLQSVGQNTD